MRAGDDTDEELKEKAERLAPHELLKGEPTLSPEPGLSPHVRTRGSWPGAAGSLETLSS